MTSVFSADGKNVPCTVIEVGPCVVTQIKTVENDGYKAVSGRLPGDNREARDQTLVRPLQEGRRGSPETLGRVQVVRDAPRARRHADSADLFAEGSFVDVVGTSKGKVSRGVVKRHGFGGVGQATHGQHNRLPRPRFDRRLLLPAKVFKGFRMAGQMGNERVTVQNLQVIKVIPEHNLLMIKGSVPGAKGSIVLVEK